MPVHLTATLRIGGGTPIDVFQLDPDGDGIACEPAAAAPRVTPAAAPAAVRAQPVFTGQPSRAGWRRVWDSNPR